MGVLESLVLAGRQLPVVEWCAVALPTQTFASISVFGLPALRALALRTQGSLPERLLCAGSRPGTLDAGSHLILTTTCFIFVLYMRKLKLRHVKCHNLLHDSYISPLLLCNKLPPNLAA